MYPKWSFFFTRIFLVFDYPGKIWSLKIWISLSFTVIWLMYTIQLYITFYKSMFFNIIQFIKLYVVYKRHGFVIFNILYFLLAKIPPAQQETNANNLVFGKNYKKNALLHSPEQWQQANTGSQPQRFYGMYFT